MNLIDIYEKLSMYSNIVHILSQVNYGKLWACDIGHFRVPKSLTFETRLSAKPFL